MMRRVKLLLVLLVPVVFVYPLPVLQDNFPVGCIPIDRAGYIIEKPGNYCFTKDIHTRLDFADHAAERAIVEIRSSNVTIDMLGHRGGRGRLFVQSGGSGFNISSIGLQGSKFFNITIKNGVLSDFDKGVYFYAARYRFLGGRREVNNVGTNAYLYRPANIKMVDVTFIRCKEKFYFWDTLPE